MTEQSDYDKMAELLDLTRENNRILRSMHRRMLWSQIFTFLYWLVILGVMGWSYYYLQPYLDKYWNAYQTMTKTLNNFEGGGKMDIQGLLEKVK